MAIPELEVLRFAEELKLDHLATNRLIRSISVVAAFCTAIFQFPPPIM